VVATGVISTREAAEQPFEQPGSHTAYLAVVVCLCKLEYDASAVQLSSPNST